MTSPKLTTRRLALVSGIALFAVFGVASVCDAESPWRRRVVPAPPPPYRISLEAVDGSALPTFRQGGTTFVLGEPGDRYNIRVDNPTGERVEAVVTVDGRDAISGDVGDYVSQRGYLIEPWGTLLVEGFRRSLDEVAAFRFTGRGGSYSALRGTPQHVGVIGVAVFPEKKRPPQPIRRPRPRYVPESGYRAPSSPSDGYGAPATRGAPAPSAAQGAGRGDSYEKRRDSYSDREEAPRSRKSASAGPSNIGTEYGESEDSSVIEVAFERRSPSHPSALLKLRYDDYDGLSARGIDLSSLGYAYRDEPEPQPFPYSRRFAPPP
ncbi:MAG TPA: hypothetical protein VHB79_07215 [Polyangiaceae bacterium]|nr:hypothetical protein [Polyangiaceae bacterium]